MTSPAPKTLADYCKVHDSDWALDHKVYIEGQENHIRQIGKVQGVYYVEMAFSRERKFLPAETPVSFKHWKESA
ncbi:hypothetical protein [Litorimonas sp.]|uniref:hypothetical protein n=1 Tax=Litorimonas sp. TaxID=1892381 RepID=UPI003A899FE5